MRQCQRGTETDGIGREIAMLKFLFGIIFLFIAGLMGWIAVTKDNFCLVCGFQSDSSSTNINVVQNTLIEDLRAAEKNKELPSMWNQILEVRYLYHSKKIQNSLNNSPILTINKQGNMALLVEFYDEPGDNQFILVRYNVRDIKTGNTVAEVNRRLRLPEAPKAKNSLPDLTPAKK